MKLRIGLLVTLLATVLRISHAQDDSLAGSFLSGMCHHPKIPTRHLVDEWINFEIFEKSK